MQEQYECRVSELKQELESSERQISEVNREAETRETQIFDLRQQLQQLVYTYITKHDIYLHTVSCEDVRWWLEYLKVL